MSELPDQITSSLKSGRSRGIVLQERRALVEIGRAAGDFLKC
jgi:hypothetical protein